MLGTAKCSTLRRRNRSTKVPGNGAAVASESVQRLRCSKVQPELPDRHGKLAPAGALCWKWLRLHSEGSLASQDLRSAVPPSLSQSPCADPFQSAGIGRNKSKGRAEGCKTGVGYA